MADDRTGAGGDWWRAALQGAVLSAVWTGRVAAYPVSIAYRLFANSISSTVPIVLLGLIARLAFELYEFVTGFFGSETFNLILAIGLVAWILNHVLAGAWSATKAFLGALTSVFLAGLPPWVPGFHLGKELRTSHARFGRTIQEGFRQLLRPTWRFLVLILGVVVLGAAIKVASAADAKERVVWVVPPDSCCAKDCEPGKTTCPNDDECFIPVECSLGTRGLAKGMEFILTYPPVDREPPPGSSVKADWDNGLDLHGHRRNLLQLVKEAAAMCSAPDNQVSLTVEGFSSDQPPQDVPPDQLKKVNLSFANERATTVVAFLCGLSPADLGTDETCPGPMPNADEAKLFQVRLTNWKTYDDMEAKRPHKNSPKRMRFIHRSVRVNVDGAGRCPLSGRAVPE